MCSAGQRASQAMELSFSWRRSSRPDVPAGRVDARVVPAWRTRPFCKARLHLSKCFADGAASSAARRLTQRAQAFQASFLVSVFHCTKKKPQCFGFPRRLGIGDPALPRSWVSRGLVTYLLPPGQSNSRERPEGGHFPPSIMMSSELQECHWAGLCQGRSHHSWTGPQADGSLWRKTKVVTSMPLRSSVSKVQFRCVYDMTKSFSLPKDEFYCK